MNAPPVRVLLFGATGQLGQELVRLKPANVQLRIANRDTCDFADPNTVRNAILQAGPIDAIINAAAYTAVDKAEDERELAFRINCDSVGALALAAAERSIPLLHVSTDYVFDGAADKPYREDQAGAPLNVYGASKLAGEEAIRSAHGPHVIMRTSWLYSANGNNFVKTMLRLGAEKDQLRIVDDQLGTPTSAAKLAQVLYAALAKSGRPNPSGLGTFHYTDGGITSWRKFAEKIFEMASDWAPIRAQVVPIPTSAYPTAAMRPPYSVLDCGKITAEYAVSQDGWQANLAEILQTLRDRQGRNPV